MFPIMVNASANSLVRIGDNYYDSLIDAIANAGPNDTITLIDDVKLNESIQINKTVNINLNGNNIEATEKVFQVEGGVLNLTGKGTIRETKPNYGAIMIKGSDDSSDNSYSVVNIGKDVTLEGWSGIFITHNDSKSYGVVVNLNGKINSVNDVNGDTGIGIYVNGNIKHQNNSPVVNILDGAEIGSTGNGLYIAGASTFNIGKAYIEGDESAIGIKSGNLNIDGASVVSKGPDYTPTEGYNNGIKASGTALQIESNNGYAGNMKINIKSGTLRSENSNVVYEYIGKGTETQVESMNISGGTFISESGKDIFRLSDSFKTSNSSFISGGNYTKDPSSYLKSGYTTTLDDNYYKVIQSTMKEVISNNSTKTTNNNIIKTIITIVITLLLGFIVYLNRTKILNLLRK